MPELRVAFSRNLAKLVRTKKSIAQVCRDLNINRQQFNRYLAGETLPSEPTLTRISAYFGVESVVFFNNLEPVDAHESALASRFVLGLEAGLVASASKIGRGKYFLYLPIPGKPEFCQRGLVIIKDSDQLTVFSRMVTDRVPGKRSRLSEFVRHEGVISEENGAHTFLAMLKDRQTDLCLSYAREYPGSKGRLYSGISLTSRLGNAAARRVAIELARHQNRPLMSLARQCGVISIHDPDMDPRIRDIITFGNPDDVPYLSPRFAD